MHRAYHDNITGTTHSHPFCGPPRPTYLPVPSFNVALTLRAYSCLTKSLPFLKLTLGWSSFSILFHLVSTVNLLNGLLFFFLETGREHGNSPAEEWNRALHWRHGLLARATEILNGPTDEGFSGWCPRVVLS